MKEYNARLHDNTVGIFKIKGQNPENLIGEIIDVHLYDENGNLIEERGFLVEVLGLVEK